MASIRIPSSKVAEVPFPLALAWYIAISACRPRASASVSARTQRWHPGGNADADVHRDLAGLQLERSLEGARHARHETRRVASPYHLTEDGELVATAARGRIHRPDGPTHALRHAVQDLIPHSVPKAVVDGLEVVYVQGQHRDRPSAPRRPCHCLVETVPKKRPVRQPGQRVVERLLPQLLLQRLLLADVAGVDYHSAHASVVPLVAANG